MLDNLGELASNDLLVVVLSLAQDGEMTPNDCVEGEPVTAVVVVFVVFAPAGASILLKREVNGLTGGSGERDRDCIEEEDEEMN